MPVVSDCVRGYVVAAIHGREADGRDRREKTAKVVAQPPNLQLDLPAPHARARFGALAYREFRLLWFGLLVSNTGSWMQMLAQGWLVVELAPTPTAGAFYLGLVGFVRAIPVLALSGLAGALADRVDRRRLLFVTNFAMAASGLALGILAAAHVVQIWHVMLIAIISAAAAAFDAPARQSLVPHLVAPRELMNAIGLNSAAFNGPAILGPAIGGIIVASFGVAVCFFINAASYVAVFVALALMRPKPPIHTDNRPGIWWEMAEGFAYVRRNAIVVWLVLLSALVALVCRPYIQLLPAFAKSVLHAGPSGLGIIMAASGAGALAGSIAIALIGVRQHRGLILILSAGAAGIFLALFALTRTFAFASIALAALGASVMVFMGMANTLLQTYTPIEMRGRVMSIYTMIFLGMMPFGSWILGTAASVSSLPGTFLIAGLIVVAAAVFASTRNYVRDLA
jgi:MFS family permease